MIQAQPMPLITAPWADYALLDSGDGRKLERYGPYHIVRPEPQALWRPARESWSIDAEFIGGSDDEGGGRWHYGRALPERWPLAWTGPGGEALRFWASCTPFRHLAFFPDMAPHWSWMMQQLAGWRGENPPEVLNLFGYTGVGSLACARAGARVTHVDASKKSLSAARENQALSGLEAAPVRWMVDDALKFLAREARRGRIYQGLILDPPKFGRGPEGEVWKLFERLPELLAAARAVLAPDSLFVVLTCYAIRASSIAFAQSLAAALADLGGTIQHGDMAVAEEGRGLLVPTALYARWCGTALATSGAEG